MRADVVVIGAGAAGLTTAALLQKEGKKVVTAPAEPVAAPKVSSVPPSLCFP